MIAASGSKNSLRDTLHVPLRHKGKVAAVFFTVVGTVAACSLLLPRTYRSESELLLKLGRENMALDPTATVVTTPILAVQQSRDNEINSVIEILRSRVLLDKVVDSFSPDVVLGRVDWHPAQEEAAESRVIKTVSATLPISGTNPASDAMPAALPAETASAAAPIEPPSQRDREDAVRRLNKSLNVEAVRKSNVLEITCDANSPELAQAMVSRLVDFFLDDYIRLNRTPGAQEFLTQQTEKIRQRMHEKEDELRRLKDATGLAEPEVRRNIVVSRIGRLEDDLLQTSAQLASSDAEVKQLRSQMNSLPATQVTEQTVGFADDASNGMRQQLYALQIKEQDLATKFTDDHPQLRQVRQQIAEAKTMLSEEPQRTQTKTGPSKPYEEIKVQLMKDEPILAALQAKADRLKSQLADEQKKLQQLNEDEMQVARLQREVQLEETNYRKYADSLEQARIDGAMAQEGKSNVSIIQPATFDLKPIKPNVGLNLALAVVVGLLGGIGLAFASESWNHSANSHENGRTRLPEAVLNR